MYSAESAKRTELNVDEPRIARTETEATRAPVWKGTKSVREMDIGETDPSVLLYCHDLLPNRTNPVTRPSSREVDKIVFTAHQKSQLEAVFRKKKFPDRKERATLAARIDVPLEKVLTWFGNRRRKWRRELRKGLIGSSGSRPVLSGSSSIQTSYQRSFQSPTAYSRYNELTARLQVPSQMFPFTPYPMNVPLLSTSNLMARPPIAVPPAFQIPRQQVYPPFPAPAHEVPQQYPDAYYQHWPVPSYPSNHSMRARNPTPELPEIRQVRGAESKFNLTDEFPFPYSVAEGLPHIFGDFDKYEDLERPLTPSFELPVDLESICDSLSDSDQSVETSSYCSGPSDDLPQADYLQQASSYQSCCFASDKDYSRGSVSKGRDFSFCRQD